MRSCLALLALVITVATNGCNGAPDTPPLTGDENLILDIGNISPKLTEIDLTVLVDGKEVVSDSFESDFPASERSTYGFRLAPGTHVLTVLSSKDDLRQEAEFEIGEAPICCSITFDFSPGGKFGIEIQATVKIRFADKPFGHI